MSHALRHEPWAYDLALDNDGWVPIEELLVALQECGDELADVDKAALEMMIASSRMQRHEIVGDRIRALYGHSISGKIRRAPAAPPARLFHGTSPDIWQAVATSGLRPMQRQYVHLSADPATATAVGMRRSPTPVVLEIEAEAAAAVGINFYEGNERVWLADEVPAEFISLRG